ncbi:hypothetical protein BC833DRAFT_622511 [Globomyces pollinis-pini]|nr:hypothetical protein BC833DRAFT_622511 [Globomyces pollinis-pini]
MFKLLALSSSAFAAAIDSNSGGVHLHSRPWALILFSILYIAVGILLLFFGLKLFRVMLFIVGFIFFSDLFYFTFLVIGESSYFNQGYLIPMVTSALSGILGGFLAQSILKVGISIVGFLAGSQLATMIWSLKEGGLIENFTIYLILVIILGIVGVVAVHVIESPSLIGGTSLIGSYMIISGLDSFLGTGLLRGQHSPAGVLLVLAATGLGVAYQFRTATKDLKDRDPLYMFCKTSGKLP